METFWLFVFPRVTLLVKLLFSEALKLLCYRADAIIYLSFDLYVNFACSYVIACCLTCLLATDWYTSVIHCCNIYSCNRECSVNFSKPFARHVNACSTDPLSTSVTVTTLAIDWLYIRYSDEAPTQSPSSCTKCNINGQCTDFMLCCMVRMYETINRYFVG